MNSRRVHFNESFFMHSDVDIFLKYSIFGASENSCYTIDIETSDIGTSYISLMQRELTAKYRFGHGEVIRFLLKSFLIHLERVHQGNTTKALETNNTYELQLFKFRELIEDNYKKGWSVAEYAEIIHVSSKTLATITKSILGKTPSQLISERTILEAKRLLRFTTLQIGEVAYEIGFDDASYFVKFFKRYVGISPINYRDTYFKTISYIEVI